jgi:CBS domain containing-hemolysin-like protein
MTAAGAPTMNDSDPSSTTASPVKPAGESDGGDDRPGDSWLDRIRAAVGLKGSGSIRTDLAAALAAGDVTASFTPEERAMLANILKLREVRVDDVMVPRADIDAVDIDISLAELLVTFRKSGHSRMPVFRDTLDDPIGMVHIKDLMGYVTEEATRTANGGDAGGSDGLSLDRVDLSGTLAGANLVRNILFVPPSMPIAVLLANMQASRMQMALVIDEYGGTDGLVSLEDAVEVIVGDIEDEYDEETGPTIVPDSNSGFLADARADLDELAAAIGTDIAAGEHGEDVDTIGGLIFSLVGRIPVRGELVSAPGGYEFEILDADPRRIKRVRIYKRPTTAEHRRRPRPSGA